MCGIQRRCASERQTRGDYKLAEIRRRFYFCFSSDCALDHKNAASKIAVKSGNASGGENTCELSDGTRIFKCAQLLIYFQFAQIAAASLVSEDHDE